MKKPYYLLFALSIFCFACEDDDDNDERVVTMEHYQSEKTKELGLPFSDAVIVGDIIYLSGQIGNLPGTLNLAPGGLIPEAKQIFKNIEAVLKANGSSLDDIIKVTVMMENIDQWGEFNKTYVQIFDGDKKPARSAFGSTGLALGAKLEVECIALKRE
jgi:2-iminobutanoate/2-iminopropanoate deaminase